MVAWFTPVWEEIWYNDGQASSKERLWLHWAGEMMVGKSDCLSVLVCGIWTFLIGHMIYSKSQTLRYKEKNNDILIACFGIQQPQNWCNACVAKIGLYLRNQSCLCHDLKWDMCVGLIYPPQLISCQQHVWLLRYSSVVATCANIALVLWPTVVCHKEPLFLGKWEQCNLFLTFHSVIYFHFYDLAIEKLVLLCQDGSKGHLLWFLVV